jgi:signal transduction histidine kinase
VFRPIETDEAVSLVFEPVPPLPMLQTDEAKVAQILRNFISNALKFTERGEVRVSAREGMNETVLLSVEDSGIGIEAVNLERIFEEFAQVESPLQRRVKGTGLGLPLSRRLARLLGGDIIVASEVGKGSVFTLVLPILHADRDAASRVTPDESTDSPTEVSHV